MDPENHVVPYTPVSFFMAYAPCPPLSGAEKSSSDEPPFRCAARQCRLCQFSLKEGDPTVAGVGPERFSAEFPFHLGDTVLASPPISFLANFGGDVAKPVLLFHSSCVEFKSFAISDDFLAVTEHSIRLSELEERQRFKRIQNLLAPKIYDLLPVKFPSEITTMISSHLVSESAMVTAENQSVSSQASDIIVDLSVDVYASYSVLDGVRYVKSLRNDVDETGEYHRVLNVEQQSTVSMVRICEDHLGIRLVQFLPLTSLSSKAPVVEGWWRDVSPSRLSGNAPRANFSAIRVESDGIKLRNITDAFARDPGYGGYHLSWPSPDYPSNKADLLLDNYTERRPLAQHVRMTYFDCNAPSVTGYTMVSRGHRTSIIHAHGQGHDEEFYKEVDACFSDQFAVYMPIDQGEYVTDIQRRWVGRRDGDAIAFVFTTNRGRSIDFGPELSLPMEPEGDRRQLGRQLFPDDALDTILKPSQQGSRIYFNKVGPENEPSVRYIGCDDAFEPPPVLPVDLLGHFEPSVPNGCVCFTSRCELKGVEKVTLCRDTSLPHKPVIGMLVQKVDGHQECLGQFRFDKALETIQADRSGGLYISLQRTARVAYVGDVRGFPPEDSRLDPEDVTWVEAPWSGTLEWTYRPPDYLVMHIPAVE